MTNDIEGSFADLIRDLEQAIKEWKAEQSAIDRGIYPK